MKNPDCDVFQDQLDALQASALPEEGMEQLRLHAESCGDCAVLLRLHEHLVTPSLAELEAAVPDELADEISLCGPVERIRERVQAWEKSPVTTLLIMRTEDPSEDIRRLREIREIVS